MVIIHYDGDYEQEQEEERIKQRKHLIVVISTIILLFIVGIICQLTGHGCSVVSAAETKIYNVSAYCLCEKCCGKWTNVYPRRTASGHIIKKGDKFIAASKNIPFGTWVNVPGYGRAQVLDRGGAIKDGCLDLYFDTHTKALKWGRQYLKVKMELK
jgi:3D (Asp-Asp-Asp) domain-containing protein